MIVYHVPVSSRSGCQKRYHTKKNCRYVCRMDNPQTREKAAVPDDWDECKQCAGTVDQGPANTDYFESLVQADADDVL